MAPSDAHFLKLARSLVRFSPVGPSYSERAEELLRPAVVVRPLVVLAPERPVLLVRAAVAVAFAPAPSLLPVALVALSALVPRAALVPLDLDEEGDEAPEPPPPPDTERDERAVVPCRVVVRPRLELFVVFDLLPLLLVSAVVNDSGYRTEMEMIICKL